MMREGYADAVLAERPVHRVFGRFGEVGEQRDMVAEVREEGDGDGREADVFESAAHVSISLTACR